MNSGMTVFLNVRRRAPPGHSGFFFSFLRTVAWSVLGSSSVQGILFDSFRLNKMVKSDSFGFHWSKFTSGIVLFVIYGHLSMEKPLEVYSSCLSCMSFFVILGHQAVKSLLNVAFVLLYSNKYDCSQCKL